VVRKSYYKTGSEILRERLRKRLRKWRRGKKKLMDRLKTVEDRVVRTQLAREINSAYIEIKKTEDEIRKIEDQEKALAVKKKKQQQESNRISGLAKITMREVPGGLPSLGKKR